MSKIPARLPQFEDRNILLITTGEKAGNLFIAKNGRIRKIHFVNALHPKAHKKNILSRLIIRVVAPKVCDPDTIRKHFLTNLTSTLERVHTNHKIHQIHLFCPSFMKESIQGHLPQKIKLNLANVFVGGYTNHKPHQLIESIAQVRNQELRSLLKEMIQDNDLPEGDICNKVAVISK